jgi:predicted nucleic acid-binding protein
MNGLAFFDTNVLVYADDASTPLKQDRAIALFADHLRRGTAVVSLQVLQEYFAATTRKLRLPAEIAQRKVEILARCKVVRFQTSDVVAANRAASAHPDLFLGRTDRSRGAMRRYRGVVQRGLSAWSYPRRSARGESVCDR